MLLCSLLLSALLPLFLRFACCPAPCRFPAAAFCCCSCPLRLMRCLLLLLVFVMCCCLLPGFTATRLTSTCWTAALQFFRDGLANRVENYMSNFSSRASQHQAHWADIIDRQPCYISSSWPPGAACLELNSSCGVGVQERPIKSRTSQLDSAGAVFIRCVRLTCMKARVCCFKVMSECTPARVVKHSSVSNMASTAV